MNEDLKSAARTAENNTAVRMVARGGYVATGVVHAMIGGIAILIAVTGEGDGDQTSALQSLASAPLGAAAVWAIAVLLWALGAFHLIDGFTQTGEEKRKWGRRVARWGQGVVFLLSGGVAASVALGSASDSDSSAESASRGLLDAPGGPVLLTLAGLALVVGGIVFIVMGLLRSFRKRMTIPTGPLGTLVSALGVVGFAAKGATVGVIGALITLAAIRNDPESAGALDTAIQTLRDLPGGAVIVGALGAGLIAYGVFCAFRARYAQL